MAPVCLLQCVHLVSTVQTALTDVNTVAALRVQAEVGVSGMERASLDVRLAGQITAATLVSVSVSVGMQRT